MREQLILDNARPGSDHNYVIHDDLNDDDNDGCGNCRE